MAFLVHAQSGISYQAVLMSPTAGQLPGADNPKSPLVNANICLRFSISASIGGIPEYQETTTASTDGFGMVNVVIGAVNPSGFAAISWVTGTKYLKVELDHTGSCNGSNTFSGVSEQPFTTVPFALYALNSGSGGGGGSTTTTLTGDVSGSATTGSITTTITNNAITTDKIANSSVTNAKLQNSSITINGNTVPLGGTATIASSPIGSALASSKILIGNASGTADAVNMSGDVSINNLGSTTIVPNAVTYAKIQNVTATNKVLGRKTAGPGVIEEIATTGSGDVVRATSPILVTPNLGVATVDSVNKVAFTAPTNGATLTIADTKTLTVSNDATVSGTNTGDQTITLTGDVIGSGSGSFTTALAPSGVTAGTYGTTTTVPTIVVDLKGRITSASSTPITGVSPLGSALNDGNIIIGDGSNEAAAVAVTGDISINNTGLTTVSQINGTSLAGLPSGILKNTTSTGVPSIASAADFPQLNQNTTGTANNVTGVVAITNGGTGSATQNFVDLINDQTVAGNKIFSGNTSVGGTLNAGATTLSSTLGVTGATTLNDNLTVRGLTSGVLTNKFTVDATTGNTAIAGNTSLGGSLGIAGATTIALTLGVIGDLSVNTDKFKVVATNGNTAIGGNLAVSTDKFTVNASTGDTTVAGTLNAGSIQNTPIGSTTANTGDFTTLATINDATIGGTLDVNGTTTLNGNLAVRGLTGGILTNKFTVDATTGNTTIVGTTPLEGTLSVNKIDDSTLDSDRIKTVVINSTISDTNAITVNAMSGRFAITTSAIGNSITVNNSYVKANSVILCTLTKNSDSFTFIQSVDAYTGAFTCKLNRSEDVEVNFLVIN